MRKKAMRAVFVTIFVLGIIIGFLLPWDLSTFKRAQNPIQPGVYDISKRMGQLGLQNDFAKYVYLVNLEGASLQLLRIENDIPLHIHKKENHFLYVYRGKATINLNGEPIEAHQGQLIIVPAGMPHSVDVDDSGIEILLFSTPPANEKDTKILASP